MKISADQEMAIAAYAEMKIIKAANRQRLSALHYAQVAIDRDRLEAEAQEARRLKESKEY